MGAQPSVLVRLSIFVSVPVSLCHCIHIFIFLQYFSNGETITYSFAKDTKLAFDTSVKKTNSKQETYSLNIGFLLTTNNVLMWGLTNA